MTESETAEIGPEFFMIIVGFLVFRYGFSFSTLIGYSIRYEMLGSGGAGITFSGFQIVIKKTTRINIAIIDTITLGHNDKPASIGSHSLILSVTFCHCIIS